MIHTTHSIRFPAELLRTIKMRAALHRRSINGEVIYLIERALEHTAQMDREALAVLQTTVRNLAEQT